MAAMMPNFAFVPTPSKLPGNNRLPTCIFEETTSVPISKNLIYSPYCPDVTAIDWPLEISTHLGFRKEILVPPIPSTLALLHVALVQLPPANVDTKKS
jgi:hypothetical protein